jgi:hypothetical protein
MSTLETKTNDNFIYDEVLDPREQDSLDTPFLRRNVAYVVDSQAGNGLYTSGEVIIDSQQIAASGNYTDWRNSTIVAAKQLTVAAYVDTGTPTLAVQNLETICALKNPAAQLQSIRVECNGKNIITATTGLSDAVSFKMLATHTRDSLYKDGAIEGFWPDSPGISGFGANSVNNANCGTDATATTGAATKYGDNTSNLGLVRRQQNWLPRLQSGFITDAQRKNEGSTINTATFVSGSTALTASAATAVKLVDYHYLVIIKPRKLCDYFDKHPMSRGVSYRFILKFNQGINTTSAFASSTTTLTAVPTMTYTSISGSTMPSMLCVGPNTQIKTGTLSTAAALTLVMTDQIDTSTDRLISGVRLYVPSFEMEPSHQEKLLASSPVVKRNFIDFLSQTTQSYIAPNGNFNVQVSTSCTNPRALLVIPRWSQTATGNGGQGFFSDQSALSPVPGCTDPLLSLINLQVKVGSNYVLPDRLYYTFQTFLDHISTIFAENGGQTGRTSGLITKKMWDTNHRYYCFDLSRYPEAMTNLPQMISVEGVNNSAVAVELQCIIFYGREAEWNLAQGSLTITA